MRPRLDFRGFFLFLKASDELILGKREILLDRLNGGCLKLRVQRGVDAETVRHQLLFGVILRLILDWCGMSVGQVFQHNKVFSNGS